MERGSEDLLVRWYAVKIAPPDLFKTQQKRPRRKEWPPVPLLRPLHLVLIHSVTLLSSPSTIT